MKANKIIDKELREKIREVFSASEGARFVRRLDILSVVLDGQSVEKVSELFRMNRSSIFSWFKKAREEGIDSLRDLKKPGRASRISEEVKSNLVDELKKPPRSLGYNKQRWDGPLLSHHLKKVYQIDLGVRQCQRLFHKLGFSPYPSKKSSLQA
jgi:transposase